MRKEMILCNSKTDSAEVQHKYTITEGAEVNVFVEGSDRRIEKTPQ
jgi:hypothetical protein